VAASLIARIEVALASLEGECSCSGDCDRERANAREVLETVRINVELLQALSGVEIPGDGKPPLPTVT
jgi:Fe-S oxidoreductase